MRLRNRLNNPTTTMRVGMSFLILASLARWFLRPSAGLPESVVDGTTGLLYGVAIACLLLSVALRGRRRSGGDAGSCSGNG